MNQPFMNFPCVLQDCGYLIEPHFIDKGSQFPPHWHDYYELELVLEGRGVHRHNDSEYGVEEGSAYLMSYYNFHSLRAETDMTILNISFNENLLPPRLMEAVSLGVNKFACRFEGEAWEDIKRLAKRLLAERDEEDSLREFADSSVLTVILVELMRKSDPKPFPHNNVLVQRALAYLYKHFKRDLSLEEMANEFSVSVTYLGTVFKREIGMAFNPYLNSVRLRYACNLLLSTELSVKDIARESGYNSVEYFLYVFRKNLGMTPGRYRGDNRGVLCNVL